MPSSIRIVLSVVAVLGVAGCGGDAAPTPAAPVPAVDLEAQTLRLGGTPGAIAAGEGAVWVADSARGTVRRLDPDTGRRRPSAARVADGPVALAVGEGGVWVASGAGVVQRLDPDTGQVDGPAIAVADPAGVTAGGGSVWVTDRLASTVTRIDPRAGRIVGRPIPVGRNPSDVVVGFGSVWVANTDDGTVSRLDARDGRRIGRAIRLADAQVLALAVDREGVWVAFTDIRVGERATVARIDPETGALGPERIAVPAGVPLDLAAGFGRVWATDAGSLVPGIERGPSLRAVVPGRAQPETGPEIGRDPRGVAVTAGAVWTTGAGDGTVTRVAVTPR